MSQLDSGALGALTIGFEGVSVTRGKRPILESASGLVHSGRLTGIVSCCGARGDFYLLNALAGQEECTGTILANGTPVIAPSFRSTAVLIDEDFTAFDELTVRQNLEYSAAMRVSASAAAAAAAGAKYRVPSIVTTGANGDAAPAGAAAASSATAAPLSNAASTAAAAGGLLTVDRIVEMLGLESSEKKELRNCSTYTRRRVSLGKELLLNPRAIFIDSAVHGLATHEARQFLQILRRVAADGQRVVVTSLVQPRWILLELLDDVIMIEGRHVAFSGEPRELLTAARLDPDQHPDSTVNAVYRVASSPDALLTEAFQRSGNAERTAARVSGFLEQCASGMLVLSAPSHPRPLATTQFFYLFKFAALQVRNNVVVYTSFFAVVLILSIILAAIYTSQNGQSGMQNRIGIIFFLISSTFLHNILFVEQRQKSYLSFQRHRAHGYYGAATYLAYQLASGAFLRFFTSSVFTAAVYSLGNIDSGWNADNLRDLVVIVAVTSFSVSILVSLVCALVTTQRTAHFVLFAIYTFNVVLAGIILNVNTLPRPFQVLSFASHIRLGYESAVVTQFVGQAFGCAPHIPHSTTAAPSLGLVTTVAPAPAGSTSCYTGDEYLSFLGFSNDRKWKNLEVLAVLSAITVAILYGVMIFYRPPRKARM